MALSVIDRGRHRQENREINGDSAALDGGAKSAFSKSRAACQNAFLEAIEDSARTISIFARGGQIDMGTGFAAAIPARVLSLNSSRGRRTTPDPPSCQVASM
jgi:hypothetical protein